MWFWWFMFSFNLLCPGAMILGGLLMKKVAGKDVNPLIGYRSRRSTRNADTWHFANTDCGNRWFRIGLFLLPSAMLVQLPFYGADQRIIGYVGTVICIVGCAVMLLSILPTEKALKATFNEDGSRK